jgi:hypothetical protein
MTKSNLRILGALAAGVLCAGSLAQPQPQPQTVPQPREPAATLAERVLALESDVARLRTGFELREAQRAPAGDVALAARVDRLESSLQRLAMDLQRVERQADSAAREASQAARDASDAQRRVQSVESRVR